MSNNDNNYTTSNSDLIEEHINRMIKGIRTFLNPQYSNTTTPEEEAASAAATAVITINPATQKHCELEIKTLQDAPRDPDKLQPKQ